MASRNKARPAVVPAIPLPLIQKARPKQHPLPKPALHQPDTVTPPPVSVVKPSDVGKENVSVKGMNEQTSEVPQQATSALESTPKGAAMQQPYVGHTNGPFVQADETRNRPSPTGLPPFESVSTDPFHSQTDGIIRTGQAPAPFAYPPGLEPSGPNMRPTPPLARPNRPQFPGHQSHPSDGSLVFGAFQGSNHTSPAPHSGGIFPPPSAAMPYPSFPAAGVGDLGPGPYPRAPNGYPPNAHGFDPSSPHSFQGSQSSIHTDDNNNTYSQNGLANGQNGYMMNGFNAVGPSSAQMAANNRNFVPPPGALGVGPGQFDLVFGQVQRSYGDNEFADCHIHFQLASESSTGPPEPRAEQYPFVFTGHRVILAESPALLQLFRRQASQAAGPVSNYSLALQDSYITSESVHLALRTLYGHPLDEVPGHSSNNNSYGQDDALLNALALVTTGSILDLPYVEFHGVAQASRFINWKNVEGILAYCLKDATNLCGSSPTEPMLIPCAEARFKYGKGAGTHIRELLHRTLDFVTKHFPTNFRLDSTVPDPAYGRIPMSPVSSPNAVPAIVHGTSGYKLTHSGATSPSSTDFPQRPSSSSRNARLASIRFGDLSPPTTNGATTQESIDSVAQSSPASAGPGVGLSHRTVLSKMLLNLPFDFLKFVLEHPDLGDGPALVKPDVRYMIMHEVVTEREARRLRAIREARAERIQHWGSILSRLECDTPAVLGASEQGDVLGWKEGIVAGANGPYMVHNWAPLKPRGGAPS